jgi:hypothetical protein
MPFSATSATSGTTRSFTSFSQALQEVIDSRVWGGIHFRTAEEQGAQLGEEIARFERKHYFGRSRDDPGGPRMRDDKPYTTTPVPAVMARYWAGARP